MYDESIADGAFVPPPTGLSGLIQQSLNVMLPRIKEELSLINSIYELKDFKSFPTFLKKLSDFPDLFRKGQEVLKPLRLIADSYLQYAFNLKPLVSDISGLYRSLSTREKALNNLITRAGRVQTRHFQVLLNEETNDVVEHTYSFDQGSGQSFYKVTGAKSTFMSFVEPTVFHAEIEYNYNYTQYQLEHARVLALLDAFGVNLNPAIIWNAIPWSFVVDWVLGVSQYLKQFSIRNMEPVINIRQYLWSVRRVRRITSQLKLGNNLYISDGSRPGPTTVEIAYRRQVQVPSASSIMSSGLSSKEFSLGAALVIARKRSRHRW
jgi:hypothetical protein